MGEFIKLISDAGDNPRFAVADAKQLLKLYEEQYAYLGDTLVNQIAKLLGGISDDAVVGEEKGARFLWAARMLKNPVSNCMTPVFSGKIRYEILYLIFDYPHKHHTFKHFEV